LVKACCESRGLKTLSETLSETGEKFPTCDKVSDKEGQKGLLQQALVSKRDCQFSSVVEQRFCKPSVVGSNPTTGSSSKTTIYVTELDRSLLSAIIQFDTPISM